MGWEKQWCLENDKIKGDIERKEVDFETAADREI